MKISLERLAQLSKQEMLGMKDLGFEREITRFAISQANEADLVLSRARRALHDKVISQGDFDEIIRRFEHQENLAKKVLDAVGYKPFVHEPAPTKSYLKGLLLKMK